VSAGVRLIDTETTRVEAVIQEDISPDHISRDAGKLSAEIIKTIRQKNPLRGKIVSREGREVELNIGLEQGVTPGVVMDVLEDIPLRVEGKTVARRENSIGRIRTDRVRKKTSSAVIIPPPPAVRAGQKVRERPPPP
jgi:hypothetical protein